MFFILEVFDKKYYKKILISISALKVFRLISDLIFGRIAADACGRRIGVISAMSAITRQIGRMRPTVRPTVRPTRGRRAADAL